MRQVEASRTIADQSRSYIRSLSADVVLDYDANGFSAQLDQLVKQSSELSRKQLIMKDKHGRAANEAQVWREQIDVIKAALADSRSALYKAVSRPNHVNCPLCGHEYENSIAEQFGLVEDHDQLANSLLHAQHKFRECESALTATHQALAEIQSDIDGIETLLSTKSADITLRDVVLCEGRREAFALIHNEILSLDIQIGSLLNAISLADARMKSATSRKKIKEIKDFFEQRVREFAEKLDVRLSESKPRLEAPTGGRGSEGPRSMMTYYYAFLHTSHRYTTSTFCPIVIDAPNQQGQDKKHISQVIDLILDKRLPESQIIIGIEDTIQISRDGIDLVTLAGPRNQLLREEYYQTASIIMRPYVAFLL
jgi:hypothetical protein